MLVDVRSHRPRPLSVRSGWAALLSVTMLAVLLGVAPPEASAQQTNDVLAGSIWVSEETTLGARRLDLRTGAWTEVTEFEAFPSRDGTEFVELIRDFGITPDTDPGCNGFFKDLAQINFRDTLTGATTSSFVTDRPIRGPIRISPDGQSLLMWQSGDEECGDDFGTTRMTVMSRSGEIIGRANNSVFAFDWAPNNQVMLIRRLNSVFGVGLLNPQTFSYSNLTNLPSELVSPDNLRVSNGGLDIAFEDVTERSNFLNSFSYRDASVWTVNLQTSSIAMFATANRPGLEPRVNSPIFSPNGDWLLVTEGDFRGRRNLYANYPSRVAGNPSSLAVLSASPTSYALDRNAGPYVLPTATFSRVARPVLEQTTAGVHPLSFSAFHHVSWTPTLGDTGPPVPVVPSCGVGNSEWASYTALGQPTWDAMVDGHSIASNASGETAMVGLKANGDLYVRRSADGARWSSWAKLGAGGWVGADVAIDNSGRVEIVAMKADGRLFTRSWTGAGVWGPWTKHGLGTWDPTVKPSISSSGSRIAIGAVKADGRLFTRERSVPGPWGSFVEHGSSGWAQIDVDQGSDGSLWLIGSKTDGRLFTRSNNRGSWGSFSEQGASTWDPAVAPSITVGAGGGAGFAAVKADGRLYTRHSSGTTWTGFIRHGAGSWTGVSLDSDDAGNSALVATKASGRLYTRWSGTSGWGAWTFHGRDTWSTTSAPAIAAGDGTPQLLAVKAGGRLYTRPCS